MFMLKQLRENLSSGPVHVINSSSRDEFMCLAVSADSKLVHFFFFF